MKNRLWEEIIKATFLQKEPG